MADRYDLTVARQGKGGKNMGPFDVFELFQCDTLNKTKARRT
jgi:hypothetical protein